MNEQQFALQVRRALDDSVERLPYRISHRLETARRAALARMPREGTNSIRTGSAATAGSAQVAVTAGSGAMALAAHSAGATRAAVPASGAAAGAVIALSPSLAPRATVRSTRPLWLRAAIVLVPLLLVALGLIEIAAWHELDVADETAEVDLAVLTDDIPISAYADRGFGVFLKNSQQ